MNRCFNCGAVFTDEQKTSAVEPHGETVSTCPVCGASDFDPEVERCTECGTYHNKWEMNYGYCIDCLKNIAGNYGIMLEYLKDEDLLADFIFEQVFEMEWPDSLKASDKLKAHLEEFYHRQVANEILCANNIPGYVKTFQLLLMEYISIDYSWSEERFAYWLYRGKGRKRA